MANVLEEISREHLECPICCETYRHPRLLPCLHSFCTECLRSYVKGTATSIICPTCRQTYPVPAGNVTEFPTNFPLSSLVEAIDAKLEKELSLDGDGIASCNAAGSNRSGTITTCNSCGQHQATVAKCINCNHALCQFCKEAHLRVLAFRSHEVVNINQQQQKKPEQSMQQKCSQHPSEQARYFCLGCGVMVCSDCAVTKHRSSEHEVLGLKEATKNRREYLRKRADDVLTIAEMMDKQKKKPDAESNDTPEKGDATDSTRRARNACQIIAQALSQSSDDDSDFLVLFGTLNMMLQQICDEFTEVGYFFSDRNPPKQENDSANPNPSPLLDALEALSLRSSGDNQPHMPPFPFFRPRWRHQFPPPHHGGSHAGSHVPHPPGPGFPPLPWFRGPGGPHPHHRPHHRKCGGRGRGRCHPHRK